MSRTLEQTWLDHPDSVPAKISIVCRNIGSAYTYVPPVDGEFAAIGKAFLWSMQRRAAAVGHESRIQLGHSVRALRRFLIDSGESARTPKELDAALLRRFSQWLKNKRKSNISYKAAGVCFRALKRYMEQWQGQPWALAGLQFPRHEFPSSNRVKNIEPEKGYDDTQMWAVAACVLKDLAKLENPVQYEPKYLGVAPPLDDVVGSNRWQSIAYRTWWWEEHCDCKQLSAEQIRAMPRGTSMVFGGPNHAELGRTKAEAQRRLDEFYKEIGAGPGYARKYKIEPEVYRTPWKKREYLIWYWENHCGCRRLQRDELHRDHHSFYVALREHHSGWKSFFDSLALFESTVTVLDLCPMYVGLLLTTGLNPSTIQRLKADCLTKDALLVDKDSIAWTKLRARSAGLTIPASSLGKLTPGHLVEAILKMTSHIRGDQENLFCVSSSLSLKIGPSDGQFARAIRRWFKRHGLERSDKEGEMLAMHAATNFRPAVARHGYEATGSLQYVKTLLRHKRAETTVDYVGRLPNAKLIEVRATHIQAIFVDATKDWKETDATREETTNSQWTETANAHCRDILNSPVAGQRSGTACAQQNACLSCQNLVITHSDIERYFAAKMYYAERLARGELSQEVVDDLMSERRFMFEEQIIPRYDVEVVLALQMRAMENPPPEYKL